MKLLTLFLSLIMSCCHFGVIKQPIRTANEVAHLFTHCLIAYPDIAFAPNNTMRHAYDEDCLTTDEYKRMLSALYRNDYVLVDIQALYGPQGRKLPPKLPAGKKPLVLSFDDVNYYRKKMHRGMNDKLIVDNGKLATYTAGAQIKIAYDNENITILENFIAAHPDFSHDGARAVLCLTGYDGILGYRTFELFPDREQEIVGAKTVVAWLKAKKYRFACHSYGHRHMKKIDDRLFSADTDKWLREVGPLVGPTDIYAYPYGEWEIYRSGEFSAKHRYLQKQGFKIFLGVGADGFFDDYGGKRGALLMDRAPVDGLSLRLFRQRYRKYFDCKDIYDHKERFVPFPN